MLKKDHVSPNAKRIASAAKRDRIRRISRAGDSGIAGSSGKNKQCSVAIRQSNQSNNTSLWSFFPHQRWTCLVTIGNRQ